MKKQIQLNDETYTVIDQKVIVESSEFRTQEGISKKNNKHYKIHKQDAYIDVGKTREHPCLLPLFEDKKTGDVEPYAPGVYFPVLRLYLDQYKSVQSTIRYVPESHVI